MRFVLAANESIGYECLKILLEEKQEVIAVITDKRYEESIWKNLRLKQLAEENRITLFQPKSVNNTEFLEDLKKLDPDIMVNIAFVQIYKPPILNLPRIGCINFHPGPLPRYGGLNPWVWAIIKNEHEYGVTLHYMKEKVDAGEIIGSDRFPISKDETGLSLLLKCYKHGATLFRKVLREILENKVVPVPQDLTQRTYYLNKIPYDGYIDVSWTSDQIERYVRALTFSPFPNPYSPPMIRFNNFNLIITKTVIIHKTDTSQISPGEVVDVDDEGVVMKAKDGEIKLNLSNPANPKENIRVLCDRIGISKGTIIGR